MADKSPSIILFDIPCRVAGKAWSPNTWKTRYTLRYKGISFETRWIEYPDIERTCKEHGIPPLSLDGRTFYACPAILDKTTGAAIADSLVIAEYLDKTYPNLPPVLPNSSAGLLHAFFEVYMTHWSPVWPLTLPGVPSILNPPSAEYFIRSREEMVGKRLNELITSEGHRKEALEKFRKSYDAVEKWYSRTEGPFLMGGTVSFGDFCIASHVNFLMSAWGENSENWKEFRSWHGGKWIMLKDTLDALCQSASGHSSEVYHRVV